MLSHSIEIPCRNPHIANPVTITFGIAATVAIAIAIAIAVAIVFAIVVAVPVAAAVASMALLLSAEAIIGCV
jgi:hypothetical protein